MKPGLAGSKILSSKDYDVRGRECLPFQRINTSMGYQMLFHKRTRLVNLTLPFMSFASVIGFPEKTILFTPPLLSYWFALIPFPHPVLTVEGARQEWWV